MCILEITSTDLLASILVTTFMILINTLIVKNNQNNKV